MRGSGNNGAAALSALTQFKAVVMKGGFMLIIRHANVARCYALEQGTRPGLIACEPRRHFLAFAYGKNVCLEKYIYSNGQHERAHTHLCVSTHLFHLFTLI